MSEELFIEKLRDLVHDFMFTNKTVDTVMWGETFEHDHTHAVDVEFKLVRYDNQ